ncbi:UPF0179 family protein [Halorientalis marina]|jgi:uncharacterized protein (UPF0179 family)|uniref:UPF0179 family protein n=1 Tax=Halorientalis marina TaxID=2931976 RepID=UPI001FF4D5C2|nr:UPF0179 family protein [Halorientalis marina]
MATVTLIGTRLAEAGTEFVYQGEASACEGCPYRDQCLNLTVGRRYRVTEVREGGSTLDCGVHDTGVTAVEVEPAPVLANVDAQSAYAGSKVALEGSCPYTGCPSHEFCEPAGAEFDTEYRIDDVLGDPPHDYCMLDRDLTLVEFAPPEDD